MKKCIVCGASQALEGGEYCAFCDRMSNFEKLLIIKLDDIVLKLDDIKSSLEDLVNK